MEWLSQPWPWYVAGPVIGAFVPALLLAGNKAFGFSSNLRHLCAALAPGRIEYLRYDWRGSGAWNLAFLGGVVAGGCLASSLGGTAEVAITPATRASLEGLGIRDLSGFVPAQLFTWTALLTVEGFVSIVVGGFLVGFGTAYAGGCTSGHAITGLADLQLPSLVAVFGFFAGGLLATHAILPLLL